MRSLLIWQPGDVAAVMPLEAWEPANKLADESNAIHVNSQVAARHEKALSAGLLAAWRTYADSLDVASLEDALAPGSSPDDVFGVLRAGQLATAQSEVLLPALEKVAMIGAGIGAEPLRAAGIDVRGKAGPRLSVSLDMVNPEAVRYARERSALLVEGSDAMRARIRALIIRSQEEGIPVDELAVMIRKVIALTERQTEAVAAFRERLTLRETITAAVLNSRVVRYAEALLKVRALMIARTETIAALNAGQSMLWKLAVTQGVLRPEQFDKIWIVAGDELTCEECEDNGAEPVGMEEDFASGDEHPPAHPNCRCAMGLVNKATGGESDA